MKTSDAFKDGQLTEDQQANLEEEEQTKLLEQLKFKWHCEKGILGCISKLNEEFNNNRGLNPVKIFVTGPPASGKSYYSAQLARYYNIPHLHVRHLSEEALKISLLDDESIGENEFYLEIKGKCEELRDTMQAQQEEARGEPPEDTEWPEIDRATLPIRVPDDILYRILRKKLVENAYRNRGYILDGFPRTHKDAKYCFLYRPVKINEETGEPEE